MCPRPTRARPLAVFPLFNFTNFTAVAVFPPFAVGSTATDYLRMGAAVSRADFRTLMGFRAPDPSRGRLSARDSAFAGDSPLRTRA